MKIFLNLALAAALLTVTACNSTKVQELVMSDDQKRANLASAQQQLAELGPKVEALQGLTGEELYKAIADGGLGDGEIKSLLSQRSEAQARLKDLGYRYLAGHPQVKAANAKIAEIDRALDKKANWIQYDMKNKHQSAKETVARLEKALAE